MEINPIQGTKITIQSPKSACKIKSQKILPQINIIKKSIKAREVKKVQSRKKH